MLNEYYAKFDDNGKRITSIVSGIHFNDETTLQKFIDDGFILITEKEQELYAINGTEYYIRDNATGKPVKTIDIPVVDTDTVKAIRMSELEAEAQKASCQMLAFMDVDYNQQRLIDIMIEIEDLKGNT